MAAGHDYSLALLGDGTVMFWGYDQYGVSGDGTGHQTGCSCVDHPVPVPGIAAAVAISAGDYLASALLADGTIKDWGYNYNGEVGNGSLSQTGCECSPPVTVTGVAGAKATSSGGYHGLALLGSGAALSWGYNPYGEVGNGTKVTSGCECIALPVPVSDLPNPRALAGGGYHSLALMQDGSVKAWGYNYFGEIGDGSQTDRSAPVTVGGVGGASAVTSATFASFALIGPSQTLSVALAGAGTGVVGGDGILCPTVACAGSYSQGKVQALRAEPSPGVGFAGFSGACTGTGPCQVNLSQDQQVTATFGPPSGTRIDAAKIRKKTAKFSFSAPGAISGYQCKLIRPKPKKHHGKKSKGKGKGKSSKRRAAPKWVGCGAPKLYKHLPPGAYSFKVRALDIVGVDAQPAVKHFKVKAVKHRKKRSARGG